MTKQGIYSPKAKRHYLTADLPPELQQLWVDARPWRSVRGNEKVAWRCKVPCAADSLLLKRPTRATVSQDGLTYLASKNTVIAIWQRLQPKKTPVLPQTTQGTCSAAESGPGIHQRMLFGSGGERSNSSVPRPPAALSQTPALDLARKHNLIGARVSGTEFMCLCPWRNEHKTGKQDGIHDQSTQVGPNTFHCRHGSCQGKRYVAEFLAFLEPAKPSGDTQVIAFFDNSGSMGAPAKTQAGQLQINSVCEKLRLQHPNWKLQLWLFGQQMTQTFQGSAAAVPKTRYQPNEVYTLLYDALWLAATNALASPIPTLVYLLTDGRPEGPHSKTAQQAAAAVQTALDSKRLTFVCVGPPEAKAFFLGCGIPQGCIRDWNGSDAADLSVATADVNSGLDSFAVARAAGETQIKKFFVDAQKLEAELHRLVDITTSCKVLPVKAECVLQPFIEESGLTFVVGANFYPLTKRETLRPNRAILVRPKLNQVDRLSGNKEQRIYSGPNVRAVLGLPVDREVTVEPGDMGNLELFLESSSHNRLLVRGTDLIVRLDAQGGQHTWVKPQ